MVVTIHINPALPHQRDHAEWFRAGLKRHGINLDVTSDINKPADIHIVSGPHYARDAWLNHRTIAIDRCYYRGDPEHISIGWLRGDGGRNFKVGSGRVVPERKARPTGSRTIFLADYDGPTCEADTVRLHPARNVSGRSLLDDLSGHAVAIGYRTSALVTAALEGLDIVCKDKRNIMYEQNWLELLPYADWHHSEIQSGEAWDHLLS